MHPAYVASHKMTLNSRMVVWCIQNVRRDGNNFTWHQPCKNQNNSAVSTPLRYSKRRAIKFYSHSIKPTSDKSAVNLFESRKRRCIKAMNSNVSPHVSRFGIAVRRSAGKQKDLGSNPLRLSFLLKKMWSVDTNSRHWFTTSFLQPLPYLVTP